VHTPVLDDAGQVQFIIQSLQDVTASHVAERQLHDSQAREQAARAEAEAQRQRLLEFMSAAPGIVVSLVGPQHVIEFANEGFRQQFGVADPIGKSYLEALPWAVGQYAPDYEATALYDHIYRTGEPYYAAEAPYYVGPTLTSPRELRYFAFAVQAARDGAGRITGVQAYASDVTAQVAARHRVEQLNQELEARVQERTRQLEAKQAEALAAAERRAQEREELYQVLAQTPAAIAITRGADHRYVYVNAASQALFVGRQLVGRSVAEALPEAAAQGLLALLDQVYATGETFFGTELPLAFMGPTVAPTPVRYFNFTYQAYREQGQVVGIATFAYDVTEQVLARQEREARQGELQRIFEQAPVAIAVFRGPQHTIEMANDLQLAIWDRPLAEALGKGLFELLPEVAGQGFEERLAGVLATGEPFVGFDVPARFTRQGVPEQLYVSFVYTPLREADGRIERVVVVVNNTTEQVLARQQREALQTEVLATSQRQVQEREVFYQVLAQTPAAIAVLRGPEHRVDYVNAAYQCFFPGQQLTDRTIREIVGSEMMADEFLALLDEVYRTGQPRQGFEAPVLVTQEAGQPRQAYFNFTYSPYQVAGQTIGISIFAYEVTEQRREREARRGELQRLFELAPVAIGVYRGDDYRLEFVNPPLAQIIGSSPDQMMGHPLSEFMPDMRRQGLQAVLDEVRRSGVPFTAQELPITVRRHQQELGYFNFVYQPLPDAQGNLTGVVCVATEVTEQVLVRQQVQTLNKELTTTNRELHQSNTRLLRTNADLDTFVYTASHDLKAPITNIEGILAALRDTLPTAVQQEEVVAHLLDLLDNTVSRFQTTIFQLTDLSRLQQTYNEPAELLELAPVVADVLADLAPQVAAAQAQVHLAVPAGLQVSFAPASLRSIVYNLLSNAVKYRSPERPAQVWLQAEAQPRQVILTVRDNGLGLTQTQQTRLFGVFQRLHTHVEGTGVGLYMIKRLIDNAGATITVTSLPGVGSTFTATFTT
jgi:PAS domain S-box-containing protein